MLFNSIDFAIFLPIVFALYWFVKDKSNPHFTAINKLCKNQNVEVIYFTAPIYRPEDNFEVLKKWLPNYYDLSMELQNINFYMDQEHLNKKGAYLFT